MKKICDKKRRVILLIFIMWFVVFWRIWPINGDDITYYNQIHEQGFGVILMDHFSNWSSRIIIEFFQFLVYIAPSPV